MPRNKQEVMRRKKRTRGRIRKEAPLPILSTDTDVSRPSCVYFTGYLQGCSVIVQHSGDVEFLYNMGFFGKGSLSRSEPTFDSRRQRVNIPRGKESADERDIVQAAVTTRRKYLAHLRYKALSDDDEDEYNDILEQEQSQMFDGVDDYEEEEEDLEEDEGDEENCFGRNNVNVMANKFAVPGHVQSMTKLSPADLFTLPRSHLVGLMTQVNILSKEQIATFVRVSSSLADVANIYKDMREKQVNLIDNIAKGSKHIKAHLKSPPLDCGFGKKGVINVEGCEEGPVVVLNSDDSEEEDGEEEERMNMNKKDESEKGWADSDDEGDAEFWGVEEEKKDKGTGERESCGQSVQPSLGSQSGSKKSDETSGLDSENGKEIDSKPLVCKDGLDEKRDKESSSKSTENVRQCGNGIEESAVSKDADKDKVTCELVSDERGSESGVQNVGGNTDDKDSGDCVKGNEEGVNVKEVTERKDEEGAKGENSKSDTHITANLSDNPEDKIENSLRIETHEQGDGGGFDFAGGGASSAAGDENQSSDDDVICVEEDSAKPAKLHQYLSQSVAPHGRSVGCDIPIQTKSVCFVTSITNDPKLTDAKVGFRSWDNVLHFNFSGDETHLPTAMGVSEFGEESSPSLNSKFDAVYERVYPPVSSLIPDPDSKGSVIKQRHEGIPYLDAAFVNLQQILKTNSHLSSAKSSHPSYSRVHLPQMFGLKQTPHSHQMLPSQSHHVNKKSSLFCHNLPSSSLHKQANYPVSHLGHQKKISTFIQPGYSSVKPTNVHSFNAPIMSSLPPPAITPALLQSYLKVFQEEKDISDCNEKEKINSDKEQEFDDDVLKQLRVQLSKTGLIRKTGKSCEGMEQDLESSTDEMSHISLFHEMLSEYLDSMQVSIDQELALLRALMYDRVGNSNAIPYEFISDAKSKLSPGQLSCLLDRMDYIQNCQELGEDGKVKSDEVITIDLSDDETDDDEMESTSAKGDKGEDKLTEVEESGRNNEAKSKPKNDGKNIEIDSNESGGFDGNSKKRTLDSAGEDEDLTLRKVKKLKSDLNEEMLESRTDDQAMEEDTVNGIVTRGGEEINTKSDCGGKNRKLSDGGDANDSQSCNGVQKEEGNENISSGFSNDVDHSNGKIKESSESIDRELSSSSNVVKDDKKPSHVWDTVLEKSGTGKDSAVDYKTNSSTSNNTDVKKTSVSSESEKSISKDARLKESGSNKDEEMKSENGLNVKGEGKDEKTGCVNEDRCEIYVESSDEDVEKSGNASARKITGTDVEKSGNASARKITGTSFDERYNFYSMGNDVNGDNFVIANTSDDNDDDDDGSMCPDINCLDHKEIWRPCLKKDPYPTQERLHLMLEEAFFLTFGLGCLRILDQEMNPIKISALWQKFMVMEEKFIPHYVAYHYFRSRGWVPKSGLKFGCDFILYREGPPFYHGSYSVVVVPIREGSLAYMDWENGELDFSQRWTSWISLAGLNRITEHVSKELMLCYVIFPSGLTEETSKSPSCITGFKVKEVVVSRWVSSREREAKDLPEEMP